MAEKNDNNIIYSIKISDYIEAVKNKKSFNASVWFSHKDGVYWEPEVIFDDKLLGIQSYRDSYWISHGRDHIRQVSGDCPIGTFKDQYLWVRDSNDLIILNSAQDII